MAMLGPIRTMLTRYPHPPHWISAIGRRLCNRRRMGRQRRPETVHRSHASTAPPSRRGADFHASARHKAGEYSPTESVPVKGDTRIYRFRSPVHHGVTSPLYRSPVAPTRRAQELGAPRMSDFGNLVEAEIPRLRRYARALTRDVIRADDLVQSCLVRAVAKQHLWQRGTDLRAWLFTILHNQHVNDVRRSAREGSNVAIEDAAPMLTTQSNAMDVLNLRDLEAGIAKLPEEQRQVILLIGLEGMRYDEVALTLGVPIGTVRSRLSRGRDQLRELMGMEPKLRAATATELEQEHRAA